MNATPILISAALSAALLAGCNQDPVQSQTAPAAPPPVAAQESQTPAVAAAQQSQTPPTAAERKEGDQPVQGQVDTKEPAQRKDFEKPKS